MVTGGQSAHGSSSSGGVPDFRGRRSTPSSSVKLAVDRGCTPSMVTPPVVQLTSSSSVKLAVDRGCTTLDGDTTCGAADVIVKCQVSSGLSPCCTGHKPRGHRHDSNDSWSHVIAGSIFPTLENPTKSFQSHRRALST
ncbi:unnamed protein product [Lampetra fluviatilis]